MAATAGVDRDQLIRDGMSYVRAIAWQVARRNPHVQIDDLIGYGHIGLLEAAQRFEPSMGTFGPFAYVRIRGAIYDGIRRDDTLGRYARRDWAMIDRARYRYAAREQRFPTDAELAGELGWTPERLLTVQQRAARAHPASLDEEIHGPEAATVVDVIPEPDVNVERDALSQANRGMLGDAIAQLPDRERMVIALRFWEEMRVRDIGDVLGVGESRASQILTAALNRLRDLAPAELAA